MNRDVIPTKDGSLTIYVPEMNATYHSIHGAILESQHVYINSGLLYTLEKFYRDSPLFVLEMGFGTGLNALLTLIESENTKRNIHYTSIELFPLQADEINVLNYCQLLNRPGLIPIFNMIHECEWEKEISITPYFTLLKRKCSLLDYNTELQYNIIYFDAFDPSVQPELWTAEIFARIYSILSPGAVLVTYCSKGDVRRIIIKTDFTVEKLAGPPGKREITRAIKYT
ncbi:MAG: tRNA (5-methylaminomethyl-2-thiouridine)(34)-methyltransferase MnmD [Bacteroidota bacterium]